MNAQLIFEREPLSLWRFHYGNTRPSFTIVMPGHMEHFPAFDDPDNADKALTRFRELRAEMAAKHATEGPKTLRVRVCEADGAGEVFDWYEFFEANKGDSAALESLALATAEAVFKYAGGLDEWEVMMSSMTVQLSRPEDAGICWIQVY
jgi:hypothetical protein